MSLQIPKADYWKPYYKNFRYAKSENINIDPIFVTKVIKLNEDNLFPSFCLILYDKSMVQITYVGTKEQCAGGTPYYQNSWYENEANAFWDDPVFLNYKIYNFKLISNFINQIDTDKVIVEEYKTYDEYRIKNNRK